MGKFKLNVQILKLPFSYLTLKRVFFASVFDNALLMALLGFVYNHLYGAWRHFTAVHCVKAKCQRIASV